MPDERKYIVGPKHLHLLHHVQKSLEGAGFASKIEVEVFHGFELHTLIATAPKKENPIQFTHSGDTRA